MWWRIRPCNVLRVTCDVKMLTRIMQHVSRFMLILFGVSLLASCGFKPMYGATSKGAEPAIAGVAVEIGAVDRRMGQQFKANLEDKLNPSGAVPDKPMYRLVVDLKSGAAAIGVARDGTVSRYNVYMDSKYAFYRHGEEKPVTSGNLRHVSSYNNLTNQYFSTYVAEQDAIKRGITELAELYRQRLSSYLAVN